MKVRCTLCPKYCDIAPGESGECRVRVNVDGALKAVVYGHPVSVHMDPIEKKPLFNFLPGSKIFSLATVGCNLHCRNCQNWQISQANPEETDAYHLPPKQLVAKASQLGSRSIAYTYTEPIVYYEYALDCAAVAREAGIRNVMVTAGYGNPAPLKRLFALTDAANIDFKAFSEKFYRDVCGASLAPVLDALLLARGLEVHIEVTNLLIPTLNDSEAEIRKLVTWVARNLGEDTPLHFSRFRPQYKMTNLPPTPAATLIRARELALGAGLYYVYIGNWYSKRGENTYCPGCGELLIQRKGYQILTNTINDGACPHCKRAVEGVWK